MASYSTGTVIKLPGQFVGVIDYEGTLRAFASGMQFNASPFAKSKVVTVTSDDIVSIPSRVIPEDGSDPVHLTKPINWVKWVLIVVVLAGGYFLLKKSKK